MLFLPPLLLLAAFLTPPILAATERKKISYGHYTVPSRQNNNGMMHFHSQVPAPCSDCAITYMQAHLEYPDGELADAESGMWMHHVVFENAEREDPVCGDRGGERFFASGNERGVVDFEGLERKEEVGYFIGANETLRFGGELMNLHNTEQEVILSITWGFNTDPPSTMQSVTPYWLDIGGCGPSEKPEANQSYFSYSSPPVTSDFHGRIVLIGTHLHDGGKKLEVLRNGKPVCVSLPEYRDGHIDEMGFCSDAGRVDVGDEWRITADYDTVKYAPMINEDGSLEGIMGIALAYVVKDDSSSPVAKKGHGRVVFLFLVLALGVMGAVGYVLWNRRRVGVWPRWASGRFREGQYGALDGPEREGLVGGEEDEENVWAQQTSRASVRLPGGGGRF